MTITDYSIAGTVNHQDAANPYTEVAETVVSFMVDCGLKDADVNPSHLSLAFEYAYKPLPRFWRDFDIATVIKAVSARFPDWRSAVRTHNQTAEGVLREVEDILRCHAFDEANGEILVELPLQARPTTAQMATDWICAEVRKKGVQSELQFAERDGSRCGECALEVVRSLEQAALGIVSERPGTQAARMVRDQILTAAHA
jgi:hypothetical protein